MGRGAWQAAVHGVAKSWTRLNTNTEEGDRGKKKMAESDRADVGSFLPCWAPRRFPLIMPLSAASPDWAGKVLHPGLGWPGSSLPVLILLPSMSEPQTNI